VIRPGTPDFVINEMIPSMVLALHQKEGWYPRGDVSGSLQGPAIEWAGKKLLMDAAPAATSEQTEASQSDPTCAQLARLRAEANISVEELAKEIDAQPRSVYRHLSGKALPRPSHLWAYQRIFSQRLGRKVLISKTSGKCQ
jgi:hypothetical protein